MNIDLRTFSGSYYPFLSWLASHVPPGGSIVELGTYEGEGSRALGAHGHEVYTCDPHRGPVGDFPVNVRHHKVAALDVPGIVLLRADLIYLDISHNGMDEAAVVDLLDTLSYRGVLVCDDINYDEKMLAFWGSFKEERTVHEISVQNHDTKIGLFSYSPAHTIES